MQHDVSSSLMQNPKQDTAVCLVRRWRIARITLCQNQYYTRTLKCRLSYTHLHCNNSFNANDTRKQCNAKSLVEISQEHMTHNQTSTHMGNTRWWCTISGDKSMQIRLNNHTDNYYLKPMWANRRRVILCTHASIVDLSKWFLMGSQRCKLPATTASVSVIVQAGMRIHLARQLSVIDPGQSNCPCVTTDRSSSVHKTNQ